MLRSMRRWLAFPALLAMACGPTNGGFTGGAPADGSIDGIVFVHGINGSARDWDVMLERFKADGWPEDRLYAGSYEDPSWGCNVDNAKELEGWVRELQSRGAQRIAIVAHSMGGLSSRYFMKSRGGTHAVSTYVSLGTMHHGLRNPCFSPLPVCVWRELCLAGDFILDLNAAPATPGPAAWTSIFSDTDKTVPATSSQLEGATNIELTGLAHDGDNGLQDSEEVYALVRAALAQ